jgi:uncharacterized protein
MSRGWLRETANGCALAIRVQPGAKKTAITGIYGEGDAAVIKVAVQAPPVEGKANEALIAYLAKLLDLPRSAVSILHGELGRSKLLGLSGISTVKVMATVESLLSES